MSALAEIEFSARNGLGAVSGVWNSQCNTRRGAMRNGTHWSWPDSTDLQGRAGALSIVAAARGRVGNGETVPARKHNVEEIVAILRQMERLTGNGMSVSAAAKTVGITDQTFYRWRTRYGSMPEDEAKRLQVLDEENTQLKRVLAEKSQDVSMLQDLTQGEILSAARRREAVDYLVERYRISERRACRLVGQHRSTQRYSTSDREDNGFTNGSPTGHAGFNDENTRGQAGSGPVPSQGWRPSLVEVPEEPWPTEGAEVRRLGSMEGPDDERRRPPGRAARIPFLDHRIPCFRRLRTSLVHDVVWLARDSETARLLGADVLIFGLQDLATTPRRLVHLMREDDEDTARSAGT